MTKEKQTIISNPELRDSSSKIIFGDKILSSQFLRDYADMEILRNIKPEDIEDVSERYVPLFSTERESDTVKRVDISKYIRTGKEEEQLNSSIYIISLIEHKTKVEYNVVMQILRYMVHIWDDYEKEMDRKFPDISRRKDFKYPPILPIVYYEGKKRWTAPRDVADKVYCKELLGEYLPHFKYQLVRLHDYSNEELLEKEDEISLAMVINKIQEPDDISVLSGLPEGRVDKILKDTPEYLLKIMAEIYRALLYNMGIPEKETENAVALIKGRKMTRLFENVPKNFQADRKRAEKAERKLNKIQKEVDETQAKLEAAQNQLDETQNQLDVAQNERNELQKEFMIYKYINRMLKNQETQKDIINSLMQKFSLSREEAESEIGKVFEE